MERRKSVSFHYLNKTKDTNIPISGCDAYSLPSHIVEHLDFVTPTIHLHSAAPAPLPRKHKPVVPTNDLSRRTIDGSGNKSDLSNCSQNTTPACIKALYKIDYTPVATENNSFGIGACGTS